MKYGIYVGKFLPPHRGHLYSILHAATLVDKLFVVISDNKEQTRRLCAVDGLEIMTLQMRKKWLCQQLQDMEHIYIIAMDESDIPEYPHGWLPWSAKLESLIYANIELGCDSTIMFFGSEKQDMERYREFFPHWDYICIDADRKKFPISATMIRKNPFKHWDYILSSARPFFVKKILITGTESTGKTTLTKALAKIYHTSWSEEVGRYYAQKFLGGDESIFTKEDFLRIAYLQYEQDIEAMRTANKICFFDTDAIVTQYYAKLYLGEELPVIEEFVKDYDMTFLLAPDVAWIDDGQRLNGEQEQREKLHDVLSEMYTNKVYTISGTYNQRLAAVMTKIEEEILYEIV